MARKRKVYEIPKDINFTGKEKAVIYTRVSSMNQVNTGNGLESQERLCREWAANNNIEVVGVFADGGVSGKLSSREALDAMIEFLGIENDRYTKIHFVIVEDIDRLSRDVVGRRDIKFRIDAKLAKVYSLKQQLTDTPEGTMVQTITMSVKQYQRESNARQVGDKQRARMLGGYWPRYQPPGYDYIDGPTGGRILQLSPDAKIIKEGLELFAAGIITSQEKFKNFLNHRGFKTRQGNKVHISFIQRLLEKNRLLFYAGYIDYPEREVNMVLAKHPPLITFEVVNQILERLTPKKFYEKCTKGYIGKKLPLRGFLIDQESGIYYTGSPCQGKIKLYFYYSCRKKLETGKVKTTNIEHDEMHMEFASYLYTFKVDGGVFGLFEDVMKDVWGKKGKIQSSLLKDKGKRITEIEKEVDDFMDKIQKTNKEQMIELYENKIIVLAEEKKTLLSRVEDTSHEQNTDIQKLISNTKAILMNPRFIWDLENLELQRMLIGIIFNNKIYYNKKSGFQTPDIPLIYKDLRNIDPQNTHLVEMTGIEPVSQRYIYYILPL